MLKVVREECEQTARYFEAAAETHERHAREYREMAAKLRADANSDNQSLGQETKP